MGFLRKQPDPTATAFFEDEDAALLLHFPSMSFVKWATAPMVFSGDLCRKDGPEWYCRFRDREKERAWELLDAGSLGARIETAYQRFLHASIDVSKPAASSEPSVFFELARGALQARLGEEIYLFGVDQE